MVDVSSDRSGFESPPRVANCNSLGRSRELQFANAMGLQDERELGAFTIKWSGRVVRGVANFASLLTARGAGMLQKYRAADGFSRPALEHV